MGQVIYLLCGLAMYVFEVYWCMQWWGVAGLLVGLFVPPIAVVFPFLYLAMEGFSALYFGVWAAGLVALLVSARKG